MQHTKAISIKSFDYIINKYKIRRIKLFEKSIHSYSCQYDCKTFVHIFIAKQRRMV